MNSGKLLMVEKMETADLVDLAMQPGVSHLVQKSQPETMREIRTSKLLQNNPADFFNFPLATTLSPRSPDPELEKALTLVEWQFSNLTEKEKILNDVEDLFEQTRLNRSLRDDVTTAANEFACNVLFNAPCEGGVNVRDLKSTVRDAETNIKSPAVMKIGAFKGYLALTCQDSYGTLQPNRILTRIKNCAVKGPGESINFDDRGTAGIGCFMVFNACSSFFMAVETGKRTQFCALFPLIWKAKGRNANTKNLHWLEF